MTDAASSPLQLTPQDLAAKLNAAKIPQCVAVAVSGGRDSMALAHLCAGWAKLSGARVIALTVDHGLRPESAQEAAQTRRWCEALGLAHETLAWRGEKPGTGLQAAARAARYKLLIEAAQARGCDVLVTAHTLDDQAETVFMRLSRGAGARGLAAMREESLVASGAGAPLRLVRPLLGVRRDDVTAYVHSVGQPFIDDPSNVDDRFERVRVRALLAALYEQELVSPQALASSAASLRMASDAARESEEELFDWCGGCFYSWGGISLDHWRSDAPHAAGLARRLLHAVGGGEFAPGATDAAQAMSRAGEGAVTLGGTLIRRWRNRIWIIREPAALLGRAGVPAAALVAVKRQILWDGRFIVSSGAADGFVAPLGTADMAERNLFPGPPEGLSAAPGLYQHGVLIATPAIPSMGAGIADFRSLTNERFGGRIIRFP